jgi:UrcA family protein
MSSNIQTIGKTLVASCTAVLLAGVLVVSNAVADEQVRVETVKFEDLNVDTPAGAQALYWRIHSAAQRVCSQPAARLVQPGAVSCAKSAEAKAIEQLNLPSLTAYYRTKTADRSGTITASR